MKKKLLWAAGIVVVIAIVAFAAGPWVYKNWIVTDADAELALPSQTQGATVDVAGNWGVVAGPSTDDARTQAGYRVDEVLRGENITVNGRTTEVSGGITVTGSTLQSGTITVDVASIRSPDSSRDNRFRGTNIMDTAAHPTATFTITRPVDISGVPASGARATVPATGTLTIKGVERPVTTDLAVARSGSSVIVQGSIPVTWSDYGVEAPSIGSFVTVDKTGSIEFLVNLARS
ncbi:polyisoprenoid-binding protein [Williamsia sp. Leaf354]|uniref:YceI family protein n=1 Tax=Williamsia sp. Leaf354 TaxID=1736349 RepID=UPI0006F8DB19|nr:YceI family protein [Williamsia sp. Leaf354]KQR99595.1 polyisoprenoid-binding protein [Williamsia sp. Leaf354]